MKRILLVRLSSVGDVLLATPVATELRRRHPDARISWLVDRGYGELVRCHPDVDAVCEFDFAGRHRGPAGIRRLATELGPVDLMIDLQHKLRTMLLKTCLRPAESRVWIKRHGMEALRALAGKDSILQGPHQIQRYLQAADLDGDPIGERRPVLRLDPEWQREAEALVGSWASDGRPLVALLPGARHETKRWPLRHMAGLADRCCQAGLGVALLGGEEDAGPIRSLADCMQHAAAGVRAGGGLGLLAALLAACRAVVAADTGPAHMAAALAVPTVVLFGPTSPERWAPPGARVLRLGLACSPCSNHGGAVCPLGTHECMQALTPDRAWEALRDDL
ncbi:MAG: glycosyltransferase family 9 protein [Deltaproteobacteria bacterium]|nr:glycosyltransferase family 9 protein [Deltaproteobacteria bacterium]